jgi:CheY-like chemotaxis protein
MARILVVEDNPQNLKLSTIILQSQGHTVIPAVDSLEAERAIAVEVPDLILMDVALPGKDGYTLTRELRARPETAQLPILALSAFAMAGDAEKALEAGCTDYLTKPVRRAPLLERVGELLRSAGVPKESASKASEATGSTATTSAGDGTGVAGETAAPNEGAKTEASAPSNSASPAPSGEVAPAPPPIEVTPPPPEETPPASPGDMP